MKVQVLQHVHFEGLGCIESWLQTRGAKIAYTRFFRGDKLPALNSFDMIIALGGPMSVNDEVGLPWLKQEKQFLRDAIARGVPVLGICLGAQLIASALGARVYRNPLKEIGWFPIQAMPTSESVFLFPSECLVFHWHGETFDLPKGAVRLAKSAGCENQPFEIMSNVIGLQFHLETTPQSAIAILDNCREELIPGPFVQSEAALLAVSSNTYMTINASMSDVLSYLTRFMS
ncbi:MAG TPA: type 1 glutamine amidotransferase [Thermodesulfovibrionales bacterium]|nr:type 1 glutamine amidotransferase [Thermodesulfovibrionales bacterium]